MKYTINQNVKLLVGKKYKNGDKIIAGTTGIVLKVYPLAESYLVLFESSSLPRRVSEIFLTI